MNKVENRVLEEILNIENFNIKKLVLLNEDREVIINTGTDENILDVHTKVIQNIDFQEDWKLYAETDVFTMIIKNYHSENRLSIKVFSKEIVFESHVLFKDNFCRVKEIVFDKSYKGFVKNMKIEEEEENLEKIFKKLLRC